MKQISVVLNVILLIAVIVLYVLHFTGKGTTAAYENTTSSDMPYNAPPLSIAYINSDTLLKNYDFFNDKVAELEVKRKKLEAEFTNRAKGLESEIANFQRTAQSMTMNQARAVEEDLVKKQQNLQRYQESLSQDLMREENKINNELYEKVANYLKEYGKQNNYQLVLTYTKGSGVLYANDSLNITQDVIQGLNTSYGKNAVKADSVVKK